jgi:hypothetical protein
MRCRRHSVLPQHAVQAFFEPDPPSLAERVADVLMAVALGVGGAVFLFNVL